MDYIWDPNSIKKETNFLKYPYPTSAKIYEIMIKACGYYSVHFFMFSNFYQVDLYNRLLWCINKIARKYHDKSHWKLDVPCISYEHQKHVFVHSLMEYTSPWMNVEWLLKFQDVVHSLSNMCLYGVCSMVLAKPHTNQT